MKPEIKEKWVAALRSGGYAQGRGRLHGRDGRFCCLGVLCDLAVKANVIEAPLPRFEWYVYGDEATVLPLAVAEWAEFGRPQCGCRDPHVNVDDVDRGLAGLNDGGRSFQEIADLIETQL